MSEPSRVTGLDMQQLGSSFESLSLRSPRRSLAKLGRCFHTLANLKQAQFSKNASHWSEGEKCLPAAFGQLFSLIQREPSLKQSDEIRTVRQNVKVIDARLEMEGFAQTEVRATMSRILQLLRPVDPMNRDIDIDKETDEGKLLTYLKEAESRDMRQEVAKSALRLIALLQSTSEHNDFIFALREILRPYFTRGEFLDMKAQITKLRLDVILLPVRRFRLLPEQFLKGQRRLPPLTSIAAGYYLRKFGTMLEELDREQQTPVLWERKVWEFVLTCNIPAEIKEIQCYLTRCEKLIQPYSVKLRWAQFHRSKENFQEAFALLHQLLQEPTDSAIKESALELLYESAVALFKTSSQAKQYEECLQLFILYYAARESDPSDLLLHNLELLRELLLHGQGILLAQECYWYGLIAVHLDTKSHLVALRYIEGGSSVVHFVDLQDQSLGKKVAIVRQKCRKEKQVFEETERELGVEVCPKILFLHDVGPKRHQKAYEIRRVSYRHTYHVRYYDYEGDALTYIWERTLPGLQSLIDMINRKRAIKFFLDDHPRYATRDIPLNPLWLQLIYQPSEFAICFCSRNVSTSFCVQDLASIDRVLSSLEEIEQEFLSLSTVEVASVLECERFIEAHTRLYTYVKKNGPKEFIAYIENILFFKLCSQIDSIPASFVEPFMRGCRTLFPARDIELTLAEYYCGCGKDVSFAIALYQQILRESSVDSIRYQEAFGALYALYRHGEVGLPHDCFKAFSLQLMKYRQNSIEENLEPLARFVKEHKDVELAFIDDNPHKPSLGKLQIMCSMMNDSEDDVEVRFLHPLSGDYQTHRYNPERATLTQEIATIHNQLHALLQELQSEEEEYHVLVEGSPNAPPLSQLEQLGPNLTNLAYVVHRNGVSLNYSFHYYDYAKDEFEEVTLQGIEKVGDAILRVMRERNRHVPQGGR